MTKTNRTKTMKKVPALIALAIIALGGIGLVATNPVSGAVPTRGNVALEEDKKMIGQPAPDFTLPDQNDKSIKLADQTGKWVVLAFYPADMTKGCTIQNQSYSEHIGEFAAKNAVVFTISTQDTASKREFCSKDNLKHTLLSDVGGRVAKAYGALMDDTTYANRWTFYIAPNGTVAYIDKAIKVGTAAEDSLAMIDKLSKEIH